MKIAVSMDRLHENYMAWIRHTAVHTQTTKAAYIAGYEACIKEVKQALGEVRKELE